MKNKVISYAILLSLFLNIFTCISFADAPVNGVQIKLDKLTSVYDNDSYFTVNGESCNKSCDNCLLSNIPEKNQLPSGQTASDIYGDGYSCVAFARYVFYYIFECTSEQTSIVETPSIGDYISLNNGKHTAIYLWEDENYIYVYNSNGDNQCGVEYEQAFSKSKWYISTVVHAENYDDVYKVIPKIPQFECYLRGSQLNVEIKPCMYADSFNIQILNSDNKVVYSYFTDKLNFKTIIHNNNYSIKVGARNSLSDIIVFSKIKTIPETELPEKLPDSNPEQQPPENETENETEPKPDPEEIPETKPEEDIEPKPEDVPEPEPEDDVETEPEDVEVPETKPETPKKVFIDVDDKAWYKKYVDYAVDNGIFNGTSEQEFSPDKTMTRAEFVQVFANIEGVDTDNPDIKTDFTDVEQGTWYTPAIKWASDNNIVSGNGDGTFSPNAPVTREMMCVMMVGYFNCKNISAPDKKTKDKFTDDDLISSWAKQEVYTCYDMKIISGTGNGMFEPATTASRAVGATIFSDFYDLYVK